MTKGKKKWTKKEIIKEFFTGFLLLGIATGGYYLVKASNYTKLKEKEIDSLFYSGCNTFVDSVKRVYDAGGREYIQMNYKEVSKDIKKEYIERDSLEKRIK